MAGALWLVDVVARETMLFAAVGLLAGGIDDLLVDTVFLVRRLTGMRAKDRPLATLPMPDPPPPLAILIGAWQEEAVPGGGSGDSAREVGSAVVVVPVIDVPRCPAAASPRRDPGSPIMD